MRVYTDGSCFGNPGPGGWGVVILRRDGSGATELYGGACETTNNRMEIMAAIMALESLKKPCTLTLYSDSKYVINGMKEWLPQWKARGWRKAPPGPIKNLDLWRRLDTATRRHNVRWKWVAGHSGCPGNEMADQLANSGAQEAARAKRAR